MIQWNELSEEMRAETLARPFQDETSAVDTQVRTILTEVKERGDAALLEFTRQFDSVELDSVVVSPSEHGTAADALTADLKNAIDVAYDQIRAFHEAQRIQPKEIETIRGVKCQVVIKPQQSVGLYVPGGTAPLPSTALMLGIPAQLAGCPKTVLMSPPDAQGNIDPAILYVAEKCGIDLVCRIGGAQAIAAMAYGTESVPAVNKIFGPGNRYVTAAKQVISQEGMAAIDMPAGPSEVLVIADNKANPTFVAIDLLSQAEHGADSQVVLVSDSEDLINATVKEVSRLTKTLERRAIIARSLLHARYILVNSMQEAIDVSNQYAPEHLIMQVETPRQWLDAIQYAGSIFLGPWAPESAGDYASGTNHVLPTYGSARFTSSLGLDDFQIKSTVQELSQEGLQALGSSIMTLAAAEGLTAHEQAVALRLKEVS